MVGADRCAVARLAEGGDRNAAAYAEMLKRATSPSSRRAGIEIAVCGQRSRMESVALLAEGGDRNLRLAIRAAKRPVALLAEGGDRNCRGYLTKSEDSTVALLAEGGDRNTRMSVVASMRFAVALLAEGGDRNMGYNTIFLLSSGRPPRGGRG